MSTFTLHVNDKNRPHVLANCLAFVGNLSALKPWDVTIEPHKKERSDPQNHALFGVAYPALEAETGFTKDELHEAFCKRFFGTVEREVFGQMVTKAYRTTTRDERGKRKVIDTQSFSLFYAMVQQVGAEAGVFVPDPDPLFRENKK